MHRNLSQRVIFKNEIRIVTLCVMSLVLSLTFAPLQAWAGPPFFLSAGRGIHGPNTFTAYAAFQYTFGPKAK
jgi:hypothetical protein